MKFNASLLREKFSIRENIDGASPAGSKLLLSACGTRMPVRLQQGTLPAEDFVIRTYNMHSCARMVGRIMYDYDKKGPVLTRYPPMDWKELWGESVSNYERAYAQNPWICVYHKGKPIFEDGERHSFLDIIEKCDAISSKDYDKSIALAETTFKQARPNTSIQHDSNVALVLDLEPTRCRCAMILRGPDRTTTFQANIQEKGTSGKINIAASFTLSAAFLEGVQLAFFVGVQNEKLRRGIIQKFSPEDKHTREARNRLGRIETEISALENTYNIRYRPERPNFHEIIEISERMARQQKNDTVLQNNNEIEG